jgi:hypothetical protein
MAKVHSQANSPRLYSKHAPGAHPACNHAHAYGITGLDLEDLAQMLCPTSGEGDLSRHHLIGLNE